MRILELVCLFYLLGLGQLVAATLNLDLTKSRVTSAPGTAVSIPLSIRSSPSGPVRATLSITGIPAGVNAAFSAPAVDTPGGSVLRLTIRNNAAEGDYDLVVAAKAGSDSTTRTLKVSISRKADFQVKAASALRMMQENGTLRVAVENSHGSDAEVVLSAESPAGISVQFEPATISGSGSSTASLVRTKGLEPGSYPITIVATSNTLRRTTPARIVVPKADYRLLTRAHAKALKRGTTIREVLTIAPRFGFSKRVTFTASRLPRGVTAVFDPPTVNGKGSTVLKLTAAPDAAKGSSAVLLKADDGEATQSMMMSLSVSEPDFELAVSPASQTVLQGQTPKYTIDIAPVNGFADPVNLSVSGTPPGSTVAFSRATITGEGDSELEVSVPLTAAPGTYVLTISATGGAVTHTAPITLVVSDEPAIGLSCTTRTPFVNPGSTTNVSATITALNGFTGRVDFAVAGLPANVTAGFAPTFVTNSGTSTLTISALASATPGTYPLTISALSPEESEAVDVILTITQPLAAPWVTSDIGPVEQPGAAGFDPALSTYALQGSGRGVLSTADQFRFAYQPLNGDGEIVARIIGFQGGNATSQAGVMIRSTLAPEASNAYIHLNPGAVPAFSHRLTTGGSSSTQSRPATTFPHWVKLVRLGNAVSAYASTDGAAWSQVGSAVTLPFSGTAYIGIAVSAAHDNWNARLVRAAFDNVRVSNTGEFLLSAMPGTTISGSQVSHTVRVSAVSGFSTPVALTAAGGPDGTTFSFSPDSVSGTGNSVFTATVPAGAAPGTYTITVTGSGGALTKTLPLTLLWSGTGTKAWAIQDVGAVEQAGSALLTGGLYEVHGSGQGVDQYADQLYFVDQALAGDGEIIARVIGFQNANSGSQAGVMIRSSSAANAMHGFAFLNPGASPAFRHRSTGTAGGTGEVIRPAVTLPHWVKLVRVGSSVSAYASPDGIAWSQVGSTTTLSFAGVARIGLAVSAGPGGNRLVKATFDNVQVRSADDFLLSANPGSAISGNQVSYTVRVSALSGFTAPVALTAAGGPAGTTFVFSPGGVTGTGSSQLTATVPAGAVSGTYTITVTGNGGALTRTLPLKLLWSGTGTKAWATQDIGTVDQAGSATLTGGLYEVQGSGIGVQGSADQFRFVYQPLAGDGEIVARVTGFQNFNDGSQAGVMIRTSMAPDAPYGFMHLTRLGVPTFRYRTSVASEPTTQALPAVTLPHWVKIVRIGNSLSAYASTNGAAWTQVGAPVAIPFNGSAYIGLAVSAVQWFYGSRLVTATIDDVQVRSSDDFLLSAVPGATVSDHQISYTVGVTALSGFTAPVALTATGGPVGTQLTFLPGSVTGTGSSTLVVTVPAESMPGTYAINVTGTSGVLSRTLPLTLVWSGTGTRAWASKDIGTVEQTGSASLSNGVYEIYGSGRGIGATGSTDEFYFLYQPLPGDGEIVARVTGFQNWNDWSQAGVMIRASLTPDAPHGFMYLRPSATPAFGYRTVPAGQTTTQTLPNAVLPHWVKLVRTGNSVSAYASPNGTAWTQVGTTITVPFSGPAYVGLAAGATYGFYGSRLVKATIDNVAITQALDFNLSVSPTAVLDGANVTHAVAVAGREGFTGTVTLSVTGVPSGATATVSPDDIVGSGSATLTVSPGTAAPGRYSLTVTGTSGASVSAMVNVTIPNPVVTPWTASDIGSVGLAGISTYAAPTFTLKGAGDGIDNGFDTTDAFQFVYQPLNGDGQIIARLMTKGAGSAGVMIRETLDAGSKNAFVFVDNSNNGRMAYREATSGWPATPNGMSASAPRWLKLVRVGSNITGYLSADGVMWTQVGPTAVIPMQQSVYVGLAVTSGNLNALSTATFSDVTVAGAQDFLLSVSRLASISGSQITYTVNVSPLAGFTEPVMLSLTQSPSGTTNAFTPSSVTGSGSSMLTVTVPGTTTPGTHALTITGASGTLTRTLGLKLIAAGNPLQLWTYADVGSTGVTGDTSFDGATFTVKGAGINGHSAFHYAYQPLNGDGQIIARLATKGGGGAGVMIRETLDPSSKHAFVLVDGSNTGRMVYRQTTNGSGLEPYGVAAPAPRWLKLVRLGSNFSGYVSADGVAWTQVGPVAAIPMQQAVYVGMAVASNDLNNLSTATFSDVTVAGAQDFLLSSVPPAMISGNQISYTVNVNPLAGFTEPVALSLTQSPSGATSGFAPSSITGTGSSTLTVTVPGTTSPGTHALTVSGTSGTLTRTLGLKLIAAGSPLQLWTYADIGTAGQAGDTSFDGNTFTVKGAGDIINNYGNPDKFHYAYQPLHGDGQIVARLVTKGNGRAGVMIRETLDPLSKNAFVLLDQSQNGRMSYRHVTGAAEPNGLSAPAPRWLKLVRLDSSFSGYVSADGITWTQVGPVASISMETSVYIGLAVSSGDVNALSTATFSDVRVSNSQDFLLSTAPVATISGNQISYTVNVNPLTGFTDPVALSLTQSPSGTTNGFTPPSVVGAGSSTLTVTVPDTTPAGSHALTVTGTSGALTRTLGLKLIAAGSPLQLWTQADVGAVGVAGDTGFNGTIFTVRGAGDVINNSGNPDKFHYAYRPLNGDGQIIARLVTKGNGRAGVMIRETLDSVSRNAFVHLDQGSTGRMSSRNAGGTADSSGVSAPAPRWLKLVRGGSTFSAYVSADGAAWTELGPAATVPMQQSVYIGLAVTSGDLNTISTSTFDNVSVSGVAGFVLSAAPPSQTVAAGSPASYTVSLASLGGFSGPVSLAATGNPAGTSISLNPAVISPGMTTTVTVATSVDTPVATSTINISGMSGSLSHSTSAQLTVTGADFSLTASPASRTVSAGAATTYNILVNRIGAFSGPVTFSLAGLPPGAVATFDPNTVTGSGSTLLSVTAHSATPLGTSALTLTASSGPLSHTIPLSLTVSNIPDFEIDATVSSKTTRPGTRVSFPISVTGHSGFNGTVTFATTGLPQGATAAFEPSTVTSSGSTVLTIATTPDTPATTFPIVIRGTSGSLVRSTPASLVLSTAADFSVDVAPSSRSVNAGQETTYSVTVTGSGDFTGSLSLSAVGLPSGATASFDPAILDGPGTTSITVSTQPSTPAGTSSIIVAAASGSVERSALPVSLVVSSAADFSLTASPSPQSVAQSGVASFAIGIAPSAGFNSSVTLSATGGPAGSTVTFDPPTIAGSSNSTMSIAIPAGAAASDYTISVTGAGSGLSRNTSAVVQVKLASSYEAEAPANTLTSGASTITCASCSNAARVEHLGLIQAGQAGSLTFNNVNVTTSGRYAMTVYYTNGFSYPLTANVSVNGGTSGMSIIANSTGGWNSIDSTTREIDLSAGNNTIRFFNDSAAAPSIDRITLVNVAACTPGPVDVMLVMDRSGSMAGTPMTNAKAAAAAFIDFLYLVTDQVGLSSYSNTGTLNQQLTSSASAAESAINALVASGSTYMGSGITLANTELASVRHNAAASKVMIVLSDGVDNNANGSINAANTSKAAGVRIITIGYGTGINASFLQSIATATSDYYASPSIEEIQAVYQSIATAICRPPNQAPVTSAGLPQAVPVSQTVKLRGAVADDGLPVASSVTLTWSQVNGPGTVNFVTPGAAVTDATFSAVGAYVLRLTANDGEFTGYSEVTITVMAGGTDSFEAESSGGTLTGGAASVPCASCSGGYRVDNIGSNGGSQNGVATFNVNVPSKGFYALAVYYTNGDTAPRTANVSINGDNTPRSFTGAPTGTWNTISSASMTIYLNAGNNSIAFSNPSAAGPSIDRVEVVLVNDPVCPSGAADVVLIIDRSGSMQGAPLVQAKLAARSFVDNLAWASDQVAAVSFGNYNATLNVPLTHDAFAAKSAIDQILAQGGTSFAPAVATARAELAGPRRNPAATPVFVLLSDGQDEGQSATIAEVNAAKAAGIRIITVGYGIADPTYMTALASSPSDYYHVPTGTQLADVYQSIARNLCRPFNQAPVVHAGASQTVTLPQTVSLRGTASDDALPLPSLTVTWTKISGPGAVAFNPPDALATTATFFAAGSYVLELKASDGQRASASNLIVNVSPGSSTHSLTLTPVASGPNLTGTTQLVQATLKDSGGSPVSNATVQFAITGANAITGSASTNEAGVATFSYAGSVRGLDTAQAVASTFGPAYSNSAVVAWVAPTSSVSTSPITGRFFTTDSSGLFNTTPSQQPAFTQVIPTLSINPIAGTVSGSGVNEATVPVTQVAIDPANTYIGTIPLQGNGQKAGVGTLARFSAVYTGTLFVTTPGNVTFTFYSDDGFLLGIGGGATRVSGPMTGGPASGVSAFQGYPILAARNSFWGSSSPVVVNFPAAGNYPFEVDYAQYIQASSLTMSYTSGSSTVLVPPAVYIKVLPNIAATHNTGEQHTISAAVLDNANRPLAGLPVKLVINGGHAREMTTATDATGYATFTYTGTQSGASDELQVQATLGAATVVSNVAKVVWNSLANQAPVVSSGPDQTLTLPNSVTLPGTVTDDGQPTGSTLTINWTKVSGPGDVVFVDARDPFTNASFSLPGTYVLKLTAGDSQLTTEDTCTITVNPEPAVSGGWIENPIYGAQVKGIVPITLVAGITLQSGTLIYWPTSDEAAITVLNPNTTGSGTIANLDTTTLPNGSYWIRLHGTNTSAVTQNNLLQITVTGEHKPGRVVATATDFTVPLAGLPIEIERTYDSLERNLSSDFGYGWKLGIDALRFEVAPTHDVTLTINGQRKTFFFTPPANPFFQGWYTPQYTAEAGFYGKLVNTGDTCNGLLVRVGNMWRCGLVDGVYQATGWKYTDPAGRELVINSSRKLSSMRDLNGNTLTIAPDGVTSSAGNLRITFVRDTQGRITKITDPLGRDYLYGYNAAGELETVTYPSITQPARYGYAAGHLLNSQQDPRGNTAGTSVYDAAGRLLSTTDTDGTTSYVYDIPARRTTITHPDLGTEVIETDERGNVTRRVDGLNRATTYTYDGNNNLLTETDPLSKTTTYTYDANGFKTSVKNPLNQIDSAAFNQFGSPTSVTNALNKTQSVTYDPSFRVKTIGDALGQIADFSWNSQGLPVTMKDARGNTSSYQYDGYGNRTSYTDPEGRTTTTSFNSFGQKLSETDPRGNTTTFSYDELGHLRTVTDADNKTTTYEYDANGNKTAEIDALNHRTTYEYDIKNRLIKTTFPDTTFTSTTYDFRGKPLTITDQSGRVTKNVYDQAGQLTSVTYAFGTPDAGSVSYTYDLAGRKKTETDERNNTTTYDYDDAGRLITVTNAQGKVTAYTYDAAGEQKTVMDANNHTTTFDYDDRGRQVKITYPDAKFVTYAYDGLGLRTSMTDQENRTTTWSYDKASQLVSVTNALNQVTTYGYDSAGNKIRQTDANNHSTAYEYDKLNRRTKRTLPLTFFETYEYDSVGNLKVRKNFNGQTITYGYDDLNRLISRSSDGATFTYRATGRRESMTDPSGVTTWTYDARDRVTSKATPQGSLTYTYQPNSLVASVLSSNANGVNISYGYDTLNRLNAVTDNRTAAVTQYTYDDAGNQLTLTYPNGIVHTYAYDTNDRTTSLSLTKGSTTLASYTQTFGFAGHKQSVTENSGRSVSYSYDLVYKLLGETITGAPSADNGSVGYTHDTVGNRLTRTSTLAALPAAAHNYDNNDRVTTDTYDNNGNTLTSSGHTYMYDFEDRLTSFDNGVVTMVYDGDGNRVAKTAGGVTTRYLVDDLTPTGYAQVAEEVVGGSVVRRYTHGRQRISQTQLISSAWTTHHYGYDESESVRQLMDSAGVVTDTYAYDAFGSTIAQTGTTPNLFLYRGEQYDAALQLYYLRARWMQPHTGRFITADTYEGDEEDPASLHLSMYAEADPVNGIDPSGHGVISNAIRKGYMVLRNKALHWTANVMNRVPAGAMRRGTQAARKVLCCFIRAWSALDRVMQATVGAEESPVLRTLDKNCRMGCGKRAGNPRGFVREFTSQEPETYWRVHDPERRGGGRWLTRTRPRSRAWAQEALALPPGNTASRIQKVKVPAGTKLRRSRAGTQPQWGRQRCGGEQFEILDRKAKGIEFGEGEPFE